MAKFTNTKNRQAPTGGGPVPALEAGSYAAEIVAVDEIDFARETADYYDAFEDMNEGWNIQFRISDGQEGANRRFFERIWLHPEEDFPEDSPWHKVDKEDNSNWQFFRFADAVTNGKFSEQWNDADVDAELPSRDKLIGTSVVLNLGRPVPDTYAWKKAGSPEKTKDKYQRNNIVGIRPAERVSGPKSATAAKKKAKSKKSGDTVTELDL